MRGFFQNKTNHTKYKKTTMSKSHERLCSKCDGFILFYSDAKPKIPLQHRDQYIKRSWKSGVGHAGRDVLEDRVISFVTWHYTVAEEHIKNNTAELNWNVAQTWQLPGMPSSTSLWMDLRSLDFSVGRITILWKNKKFTLLKFHRRILRPKHSGFSSPPGTNRMLYSKPR